VWQDGRRQREKRKREREREGERECFTEKWMKRKNKKDMKVREKLKILEYIRN
jgi:hypothetical protein